jgi:hypothetical protein
MMVRRSEVSKGPDRSIDRLVSVGFDVPASGDMVGTNVVRLAIHVGVAWV